MSGRLVGPLFWYDVIRLARRGRSILLRCIYALLLLLVLSAVYTSRFPQYDPLNPASSPVQTLPIADLARFARSFVTAIVCLQGAAVLVLTPAYLAGAIAEEKEHKTLDLLFTTDLRDREIILGKLFGRLTHLAGVLLTGLPILSLTQLWGGVDMAVLVAAFAVTGLTLLSVGSVSILLSVHCRHVLGAVVCSYLLVAIFSVSCLAFPFRHVSSPIVFMMSLDDDVSSPAGRAGPAAASPAPPVTPADPNSVLAVKVGTYAAVHGLIALGCILAALAQLRAAEPEPLALTVLAKAAGFREAAPKMPLPTTLPWEPAPYEVDPLIPRVPPVSDRPLLWKEMHRGGSAVAGPTVVMLFSLTVVLPVAAAVLSLVLIGLVNSSGSAKALWEYLHCLVRGSSVGLTAIWCAGVAFRAASSVSRERDNGTLVGLLTLPVGRVALLRAKWLGSIVRLRYVGYCLGAVWVCGLISGALHPLAVLLLATACAAHLAFFASMGIWLSVVSRTTLWAQFSMAFVLLFVGAGSWTVLRNLEGMGPVWRDNNEWAAYFLEVGLNPPAAWWSLGFSWTNSWEMLDDRKKLTAALTGLLLFAELALLFWVLACERFRRRRPGRGRAIYPALHGIPPA